MASICIRSNPITKTVVSIASTHKPVESMAVTESAFSNGKPVAEST